MGGIRAVYIGADIGRLVPPRNIWNEDEISAAVAYSSQILKCLTSRCAISKDFVKAQIMGPYKAMKEKQQHNDLKFR